MKKVVITGGHFTPGLAVIEELQKRGGWEICWIGEEKAVRGQNAKTLEAQVLPNTKVPFYTIKTYKLQRRFFVENIVDIWKLALGFCQSFSILKKEKPNVILSFGGYISVPVAVSAWILGIPVIIHEQTTASGLANRLVSKTARYVAISFEESSKYFPKDKVVLTGNPVRYGIFKVADTRKVRADQPIIYITGGSRGSQIINQNVAKVVDKLTRLGEVIHQTGELDFLITMEKKESMSKQASDNYLVSANFTPREVEEIYKKVSIVISRAGANTVSELAALGIPSILIPISWSESDEQTKNAKLLEDMGAAIIIFESNLTPDILFQAVEKITNEYKNYSENASLAKKLVPPSAASGIVALLEEVA